jgi:hypothetical protein
MNSINDSAHARTTDEASPVRTSELLRRILSDNPGVETFTVERVLASLGKDRLEASLIMFSLPAIVPVSTELGAVSLPTGAVACQMLSGERQIAIPRFVLRRTISRKSLAVAIHSVLPLLEASEKMLRPRWNWVGHPNTRRAIGLFVLLLTLAIAWPLFGFNALHATSIFVMALGMAEQDGLAVLIGAVVGFLSLVAFALSGMSAQALRVKSVNWLRKMAMKLGLTAFARYLRARGYRVIARILTFQWSDLLSIWDPEGIAARRRARRPPAPKALVLPRAAVRTVHTGALQLALPARTVGQA